MEWDHPATDPVGGPGSPPPDPRGPARDEPVLCFTYHHDGPTLVLALSGDIDASTRMVLDAATARLARHHGPVHIDITGVGLLTSAAVHFLIDEQRRCIRDGRAFRITGARDHPAQILALCGLTDLLGD